MLNAMCKKFPITTSIPGTRNRPGSGKDLARLPEDRTLILPPRLKNARFWMPEGDHTTIYREQEIPFPYGEHADAAQEPVVLVTGTQSAPDCGRITGAHEPAATRTIFARCPIQGPGESADTVEAPGRLRTRVDPFWRDCAIRLERADCTSGSWSVRHLLIQIQRICLFLVLIR